MPDVETQVRSYARAVLDSVEPVTADEARRRAQQPRWRARVAAVAAAIALVAGVVAVATRNEDVTTMAEGAGGHPLTLDGHRDWQLALFNGRDPSDAELRSRLSDEFLAAVPPAKFREAIATVRGLGPWRVLEEVERRKDALAVQLVADSGQQARLTVAIGGEGKLTGSTILLATPCAEPVAPSDARLSGPLGDHMRWYLDLINSSRAVTEDEITTRFAPSFLEHVSASTLAAAQAQVRPLGPFTERYFEGQPTATELNLRLGVRTGEEARLHLVLEPNAPNRIVAFSILTQQPCALTR